MANDDDCEPRRALATGSVNDRRTPRKRHRMPPKTASSRPIPMSKSARISAARAHAGREEESDLVTSFNVDWRGYRRKKTEARSQKTEVRRKNGIQNAWF
jgi:hypothetical protein